METMQATDGIGVKRQDYSQGGIAMAVTILEVRKESCPAARFIGKRYEGSGEPYTMDPHNMCLEELKTHGFLRKEDDWCFERYNCPRFTTPDENGNVILDYGIAIM